MSKEEIGDGSTVRLHFPESSWNGYEGRLGRVLSTPAENGTGYYHVVLDVPDPDGCGSEENPAYLELQEMQRVEVLPMTRYPDV